MKIFRRILIGLVIILGLLGGAGYYYIQQNTYEPSSEAQVLVKEGKQRRLLIFEGEKRIMESLHYLFLSWCSRARKL